jgi:hypothetical protein
MRNNTKQAIFIITEASKILRAEPNLLEVDAPITGQYLASRLANAKTNAYNYENSVWRYSWPIRKTCD